MRKGIARIISGIVLLCFQLMSVLGLMKSGMPLPTIHGSGYAFWYDLIYLLSYYLIGIVGMISLISGVFAYTKYQSPTLIRYHLRKVFNADIFRQVIPYAIISILVIVLFVCFALLAVRNHHLSMQVNDLRLQVDQLIEQSNAISDKYDSLSSDFDEVSENVKNLNAYVHILNEHDDRYSSQSVSVMNCIVALYHKTGLCKSGKSPCIECMNRVAG